MRVLIVGQGGREHALGWRAKSDGHEVLAAPGNPGLARVGECLSVAAEDHAGLLGLALERRVDLVVIGPEAPLASGLADALRAAGVPVFGPGAEAARLESSKLFAKERMADWGLPTAPFEGVTSVAGVLRAAARLGYPAVLKADGLAAGKGVAIVADESEARRFAESCLVEGRFGTAGRRLVVEAFQAGEEASLFFLCDGRNLARFLPARDYKRVGDGDRGPNTGGMGAVAPCPMDPELARAVEQDIARRVVAGMAELGTPFSGLLYVGLMRTPEGVRVLEFNVRFGDPETQVLLPLVDGDFISLLLECARGELSSPLRFANGTAVGVVLAAPGYPDSPVTGGEVRGLAAWPAPEEEDRAGLWCFHAGTEARDGRLVSAGGRVVTVVARAREAAVARERAYEGLDRLDLEGAVVRRDIAGEPALRPG